MKYQPDHKKTHWYVSTACHHDEHDKCRLTCKFCPSKCRCLCHASSMSLEADTWMFAGFDR